MNFSELISSLARLNAQLSQQAARQADQLLTLRNWLFGLYIVEFEQRGEDRAAYGQNLIPAISGAFKERGLKGFAKSNLYLFRNFYLAYPYFGSYLSTRAKGLELPAIFQTASGKLTSVGKEESLRPLIKEVQTQNEDLPPLDPEQLLTKLGFSHFVELLKVDDPLKRRFYEVEALKNGWKVRELRRAIDTLLFERTGLSTNKAAVIERIRENQPPGVEDLIRSPYLLEFLGLEEKPEYSENDLETAIIDHLQDFLLELGRGFCFEARQKRISFGNRHYRIDLVFYHRILKCHVLIDLKIGDFDHADAGQMNVYLNYYKANEMHEGDNPPVGIILCASKDDALVEYATSGLAQEIFVSKYLTQLPDKEQLRAFIRRESEGL